jgi:hypothetical protein
VFPLKTQESTRRPTVRIGRDDAVEVAAKDLLDNRRRRLQAAQAAALRNGRVPQPELRRVPVRADRRAEPAFGRRLQIALREVQVYRVEDADLEKYCAKTAVRD